MHSAKSYKLNNESDNAYLRSQGGLNFENQHRSWRCEFDIWFFRAASSSTKTRNISCGPVGQFLLRILLWQLKQSRCANWIMRVLSKDRKWVELLIANLFILLQSQKMTSIQFSFSNILYCSLLHHTRANQHINHRNDRSRDRERICVRFDFSTFLCEFSWWEIDNESRKY